MSEYFKWVESRYGGKMYFMGSNFGYCPVGGLKEKQNWRTGFSSPSNFGIFKDTEETSPPYSGWEKDCLMFFFEEISSNKTDVDEMYIYLLKDK